MNARVIWLLLSVMLLFLNGSAAYRLVSNDNEGCERGYLEEKGIFLGKAAADKLTSIS